MKKLISFIPIIIFLIATGCTEDDTTADLDGICQAIAENDSTAVGALINMAVADLPPADSTSVDPIGHKANFEILIEALNMQDCVEEILWCYACIKTLPPQTEIDLTVSFNGQTVKKILDISTPKDGNLSFVRMHD